MRLDRQGLYVAICGYMWLYVAICGYMWLYVTICGYMWLYVAICGYMWLYVALNKIEFFVLCIFFFFRISQGVEFNVLELCC